MRLEINSEAILDEKEGKKWMVHGAWWIMRDA
jgi:hypothetical protein